MNYHCLQEETIDLHERSHKKTLITVLVTAVVDDKTNSSQKLEILSEDPWIVYYNC